MTKLRKYSGRAFTGKVPARSGKLASHTARPGDCLIDCPVCGTTVSTKQHGTVIRGHRAGSKMKNSWPCPGSGTPVEHNEEAN